MVAQRRCTILSASVPAFALQVCLSKAGAFLLRPNAPCRQLDFGRSTVCATLPTEREHDCFPDQLAQPCQICSSDPWLNFSIDLQLTERVNREQLMSHHCRLTGNGCVLNFDVPDSTKPVVREKLQDPTEIRAVEHCSEAQSGELKASKLSRAHQCGII